jgi:hypothetical protein
MTEITVSKFNDVNVLNIEEYCSDKIVLSDSIFSPGKIPKCWAVSDEVIINIHHGQSIVYKCNNVVPYPSSDLIVQLDNNNGVSGVFFEKSKVKRSRLGFYRDKNLLNHTNNERINIKKLNFYLPTQVTRIKRAISCLTTQDWHWGHFIVETLQDLYYLFNMGVIADILIPNSCDKNIVEILEVMSLKFNFNVIKCDFGVSYIVNELYILPQNFRGHAWCNTLAPTDAAYIKDYQIGCLYEVANLVKDKFNPKPKYQKSIFLSRKSRISKNKNEIEQFFLKNNFIVIEDLSNLSLKEKVELFSGCNQLAGFFGSGFYNALFCEENLTTLVIGGTSRCSTSDISIFTKAKTTYFQCSETQSGPHAEFFVDLDDLKECFYDVFGTISKTN